MDKKVTGIIAYLTIIGWVIAYCAGDKEGAKFHLNQALVVAIGGIAISVLSVILVFIPIIGTIVSSLLSLAIFVYSILGIIFAAQEQDKELPLIGSIKILK